MATDFNMFNRSNLDPDGEEEYKDYKLDASPEAMRKGNLLIQEGEVYWSALRPFRDRRKRARDYQRGQQWSDLITDPDDPNGPKITEEEYLIKNGKQPTVNNQILQLIKNMKGQFRDNDYKPMARARAKEHAESSEMMSNAIQYVYDYNELNELDAAVWQEFLISGVIAWKSGYDWDRERNLEEVVNEAPSVPRMFWNTDIRDVRMKDLRFIGEIHDVHYEELMSAFADTPEERELLKTFYANGADRVDYSTEPGSDREDGLDFYTNYEDHLVRFIEIWKLEKRDKVFYHDILNGEAGQHVLDVENAIAEIEFANEQRMAEYIETVFQTPLENATEEMIITASQAVPTIQYEVKREDVWCYYFISPTGHILKSGETPYEHESHPYTFRAFSLIDGEIYGFIEGIIDQQKNINRYLTIMDFMLTSSAKGVLLIPEESIPKGWTAETYADQIVRHNGVIVYKPGKTGAKPEQMFPNATSPAASQLLNIQLGLLKEISGVTEAIQGQTPSSGTPASLYAQMTANATISSKDYFEFFFSARKNRDFKNLQVILQAWQEDRYINVSGQDYENDAYIFNPEKVQDASFDIVIAKSNNSPIFRQLIDDYLFQFLMNGLIDLPMFLDNTSLPFAGKLQQAIEDRQRALQEAQGVETPPEQGGQLKMFDSGGNGAQALINQFMGQAQG